MDTLHMPKLWESDPSAIISTRVPMNWTNTKKEHFDHNFSHAKKEDQEVSSSLYQ